MKRSTLEMGWWCPSDHHLFSASPPRRLDAGIRPPRCRDGTGIRPCLGPGTSSGWRGFCLYNFIYIVYYLSIYPSIYLSIILCYNIEYISQVPSQISHKKLRPRAQKKVGLHGSISGCSNASWCPHGLFRWGYNAIPLALTFNTPQKPMMKSIHVAGGVFIKFIICY